VWCDNGTTMNVKVDSTVGLSCAVKQHRNQTNLPRPSACPSPRHRLFHSWYEAFQTDPKNCCASNTSRTVSS
jgi:hypothetical protein